MSEIKKAEFGYAEKSALFKERNTILRSTMPQPPPKGTTCRWEGKALSKAYAIQKKHARKWPMHSAEK